VTSQLNLTDVVSLNIRIDYMAGGLTQRRPGELPAAGSEAAESLSSISSMLFWQNFTGFEVHNTSYRFPARLLQPRRVRLSN